MTELITKKLLKNWDACDDGYKKFNKLFPKGATIEAAIAGLDEAGDGFGCKAHDDWSYWLFVKCRINKIFENSLAGGYRNSGNWNSGNINSGSLNSGNMNSGSWNSGNINLGNMNSGYMNSGSGNSGYMNSGNENSGNRNSGIRNSGNWNSGNWNSGNWNSGNMNSGAFNTETPDDVMVFNKPCKRIDFENYLIPNFVYFELTYWVDESKMTDAEKVADPHFHLRGGQLRKKGYKEAFRASWEVADKVDRDRIKDCPNFDANIFFEISGIDLR